MVADVGAREFSLDLDRIRRWCNFIKIDLFYDSN